jgi:hypothetical protein
MSIRFGDILQHNNPNFPIADITDIKGGLRSIATFSDASLLSEFASGAGGTEIPEKYKTGYSLMLERSTGTIYYLSGISATNSSDWSPIGIGGNGYGIPSTIPKWITPSTLGNSNITDNGDTIIISGNLRVIGTTSTISSENLLVKDPIILLAGSQSGVPIYDAGLFINRGSSDTQAFIWDESETEFKFITTTSGATISGNVLIGSYSSVRTGALKVESILIADGTEGLDKILISDTTGLASWTSSSYLTASALVPYLTTASASATYYSLTNPSGYITASALVPYLTIASASGVITDPNSGISISPGSTNSTINTTYNTALDPSLTMLTSVGGIPFGTTAGGLFGRNLVSILDDLLFPTVNPTYTIPTITLTSTFTGIREVGIPISPFITLTGTENDANFFSQLVIQKSVNGGGSSTLLTVSATSSMTITSASTIASQFGYVNPNNPNFSYAISTVDALVVPAPASGGSSTVVYSGLGDYTAGLAKKNNKGVTHSATAAIRSTTASQAAANSFASNTQTTTGYYPYFYGKTSTQKTAAEIVTIIQSGTGFTKVVNAGSGSLSMAFGASGEWPWFAVYSVYNNKTNWVDNTNALNNGNIGLLPTDLFASPTTLSVTSSDGYWTVTFKIYPANKVTTLGTATIA